MQKNGLGTHDDKNFAYNETRNTPQFIRPIDSTIFEKRPYQASVVRDINQILKL